MSFRKSFAGMQTSLLGYYNHLPESRQKKMEISSEAAFHSRVVARINEEPFGVLYCQDNGAPNKPIRQLVGSSPIISAVPCPAMPRQFARRVQSHPAPIKIVCGWIPLARTVSPRSMCFR